MIERREILVDMHKFLRAVGFSMYQKKRDIESLLALLQKQPAMTRCLQVDDTNICEIRAEAAPGIGISVVGELDQGGKFDRDFYFPYIESFQESTKADCSIQRHAERETYAGMADEMRIGISLIFYVQNFLDYREKCLKKNEAFHIRSVNLVGLSTVGKILLPVKKTQKQIEMAQVRSNNRNSLIEAARNGDENAMETLTYEDIDLYSKISRRAVKEDLYSIIDSCFMPCGIECDQYSVIGEIKEVQKIQNIYTKEEIWTLKIECSEIKLTICINSQDLFGEPAVGRRFKGQIWMQGILNFEEIPKKNLGD